MMENTTYVGSERRAYPRYDCSFGVSYKRKDGAGTYDYSQVKNISLAGALLSASECFDKGTILEMILRIPFTPSPVSIEGVVVWNQHVPNSIVYEIGITFARLDSVLARFINERLR